MGPERVLLPDVNQFGFCEGVEAAHVALGIVSSVAKVYGINTIYGYHDIVHNEVVAKHHTDRGVVFIDDIAEAGRGSIVVGSAHGSSPLIARQVEEREGLFFDAACPLVLHTHNAVKSARRYGEKLIYIVSKDPTSGGKIHDEILGTMGHINYDDRGEEDVVEHAYLELDAATEMIAAGEGGLLLDSLRSGEGKYRLTAQTTLLATGVNKLKSDLEVLLKEDPQRTGEVTVERVHRRDVCVAVENRQQGVLDLMDQVPVSVVVVSSKNSKNGIGYRDLARAEASARGLDTNVYMVGDRTELPAGLDEGLVAVTASASTPDHLTRGVVEELGGDVSLVPDTRDTFYLRGLSRQEVAMTVAGWWAVKIGLASARKAGWNG